LGLSSRAGTFRQWLDKHARELGIYESAWPIYSYSGYLTDTSYTSNVQIFVIRVMSLPVTDQPAMPPMKQILSLSKQLGPLLQSARKSAGLTQAELAQRLGMSQSRISAMELDPGTINVEQLLALLAALNHEVLVQPKQGVGERRDSSTPDW
jgi:HTH-type transcriptional regulator/antitoxin HipB